MQLLFLVLPLLAVYFLIMRPNKRKVADRELMVVNLSVGDVVITIGGLHGVIVELDDEQTLILQVEDGTRIRIDRRAMQKVITDDEVEAVDVDDEVDES
ncbi:MAG: preprotein translocase subunit YajC [Acidimicrobiales bacterium]